MMPCGRACDRAQMFPCVWSCIRRRYLWLSDLSWLRAQRTAVMINHHSYMCDQVPLWANCGVLEFSYAWSVNMRLINIYLFSNSRLLSDLSTSFWTIWLVHSNNGLWFRLDFWLGGGWCEQAAPFIRGRRGGFLQHAPPPKKNFRC